jgi:hypothetical protein
MLGIAPTSTFRLHAALKHVLSIVAQTEDARVEAGPLRDLEADDAHIYGRELYDAEYLAATRLAQLLGQDTPLFKPEELEGLRRELRKTMRSC